MKTLSRRAVGLQCVFGGPLAAGAIDRVADLFVDPRWPWVPDQLRIGRVPGMGSERPMKGRGGRANVRAALAAPDVAEVGAICHERERENHAWLYVHTGRHRVPGAANPFELRAFCRAEWMPEGTTIEPWLGVLHELVQAVGAAHGAIVVDDEAIVHDEVSLVVTTANGARVNPRWAEVDRLSGSGAARHGLGERFVRHPRWGTYLKPAHVAALGGRAQIEAVVQPAEDRRAAVLPGHGVHDQRGLGGVAREATRIRRSRVTAPRTRPARLVSSRRGRASPRAMTGC